MEPGIVDALNGIHNILWWVALWLFIGLWGRN